MKNLTTRLAIGQRAIQYHNTLVTLSQTQFVLRTDHSMTLFPTDFAFLNLERFPLLVIESSPNGGYSNLLSLSYIGSPTDNRYYASLT